MREWLVAADDRTGAFEVAALFAQFVGAVTVTVDDAPTGSGVVDIGTRTMSVSDAARVAGTVDTSPSTWIGHKIDSTLRGNWPAELRARQRATGRRVVVIPAWPELGRTCIGGVVSVDGAPIGSALEQLEDVDLLADADELRAWLSTDGAIAVCDVSDSDAMRRAAAVLAGHDLLVAGPAGPLGAVFGAHRETVSRAGAIIGAPVLVVSGSDNPVAREQVRRLQRARPDVAVVATAPASGELSRAAAAELATLAREHIAELQPRTIVIIGGDTAAELLGSQPRLVSGFAALGMPFTADNGPLIITKAGGFGGPDALVDLVGGENGS